MNWYFWRKAPKNSLDSKIEGIVSGKTFEKLPGNIKSLDDSYRVLIRELAKR
jgi:hypothetical protein